MARRIFIVRPFGDRTVLKKKGDAYEAVKFNFDKVEQELIRPAMAAAGLTGGTTGEIFSAGDIKEDMFSALLTDDVVICDITIHNANVFYELGIRHALRSGFTILIRNRGYDDVPFDIHGFRYLDYDINNLSQSVDALVRSINETIRDRRTDSPVFKLLPDLIEQQPERFLAVPDSFKEDVSVAAGQPGKLGLYADEIKNFKWYLPGLRLIAASLFRGKYYEPARIYLEKINDLAPNDVWSNLKLGTVYQKLSMLHAGSRDAEENYLHQSGIAINRALINKKLDKENRSEGYALLGSNYKIWWQQDWESLPLEKQRKAALLSSNFQKAIENYRQAFMLNPGHFYSGQNYYALLLAKQSLAKSIPDTYRALLNDEEDDNTALRKLNEEIIRVGHATRFAVDAALKYGETEEKAWARIAGVDLFCLMCDQPDLVAAKYEALPNLSPLVKSSAAKQLKLLKLLGVKPENMDAGLSVLDVEMEPDKPGYFFLFSGHMIDAVDRPVPRFPEEMALKAAAAIRAELMKEQTRLSGKYRLRGIAGGACGGDIIFHEQCHDLDIPTRMMLALPKEEFVRHSVNISENGKQWTERFHDLLKMENKNDVTNYLNASRETMPAWLGEVPEGYIWERTNKWMLNTALQAGGENMTFFALWNGEAGDGPGGVADMINQARLRGAKIVIIPL